MSDAGGAGGAGGADGGRGGGGADRGGGVGQSGNADVGNNDTTETSSAARAPNTGALGASVSAAMSDIASAVKSLVGNVLDSIAPSGLFSGSLLGQVATQLGVPASIVESRLMDVAYAAVRAVNPSLALADGLVATGQATVAGALTAGVAELATRYGMPGFAAKALADMAATRLAASSPVLGQSVASTIRQGFSPVLDKATQEMGLDFARQVAARVEGIVPGATQGLAKAGASVWRDAVQTGIHTLGQQTPARLQQAVPALMGNPGLSQLTQALSAGRGAPANAAEELILRDPNAYVQQELGRFTEGLAQHAQQAFE